MYIRPSPNYRGAVRCSAYAASRYGILRRCRFCAARAGFVLRSAAHCDPHCGVNANGTHMHNRDVCVYYMYMARRIATGGQHMYPVRPPRCGICGAYVVGVGVIAHELVVACSACAGALWVDVIKRRIAVCTYAWVRCHYGV